MSTLVTFPRLSLQAALDAHLRALGTMDTETLRYPNAPSVTTVEQLCEAVRAAEEERAELVAALVKALRGFEALYAEAMASTPNVLRIVEVANDVLGSTGSVQGRAILADAAIARARGTAAKAHHG